MIENQGRIPQAMDGQLLGGARTLVGRDLDPSEKKLIRECFIEACRKRLP